MKNSELIQRLRDKDPSAIEELTDHFLPSLWRFVYIRVNSDPHLAEDVIGESVLALVRTVNKETPIENPHAWLRSVALHKIRDHYRAASRVSHLMRNIQHTTPTADETDAQQREVEQERRDEVREAMDQLPEHYQVILEWKYVDRISVIEIAERMETSPKSIESILFRARRELREKLTFLKKADERKGNLAVNPQPPPAPPDSSAEMEITVNTIEMEAIQQE